MSTAENGNDFAAFKLSLDVPLACLSFQEMSIMNANSFMQPLTEEFSDSDSQDDSARYGVDIRGFRLHKEAEELAEILALLDGLEGKVSVFDRRTRSVYWGTATEIRNALSQALQERSEE